MAGADRPTDVEALCGFGHVRDVNLYLAFRAVRGRAGLTHDAAGHSVAISIQHFIRVQHIYSVII